MRSHTLALVLSLLASRVLADTGSIQGNTDWPESPTAYTVIALPANYKTDPLSQDILKGFQTDPTLKELRSKTKVWTYDADNADFKYRWASRIKDLPTVIVMEGDKVVYKRSKANTKELAEDIRKQKVCGRFPNRPSCPGPNCPNCPNNEPDDDCPTCPQNRPNRTPQNRPNSPKPSNPSRPLIPDTGPDQDKPATPLPPPVDDGKLKDLTARVEQLEARIKVLSITEGKPGPPGPAGPQGLAGVPGPAGLAGRNGEPGKDGHDGKSLDLDALVAQVVAKLPPITFVEVDHAGSVLSTNDVFLGHKVKFSPFAVNYLDGAGKTLDTEYVQPFGGTLNLHIDVLKK